MRAFRRCTQLLQGQNYAVSLVHGAERQGRKSEPPPPKPHRNVKSWSMHSAIWETQKVGLGWGGRGVKKGIKRVGARERDRGRASSSERRGESEIG